MIASHLQVASFCRFFEFSVSFPIFWETFLISHESHDLLIIIKKQFAESSVETAVGPVALSSADCSDSELLISDSVISHANAVNQKSESWFC